MQNEEVVMGWYPNSDDFDDALDAQDRELVMPIINGRQTMSKEQTCEGCVHLYWKAGAMFMDDAHCRKFGKWVGDDWCAATAPTPLDIDCYTPQAT